MKRRVKYLLMAGIISLSAVGSMQFIYAEENSSDTEIDLQSDDGQSNDTVTEAPVTEAPATEAPATEAPATEVPPTEAPATEPETQAPQTEPATEVSTETPTEVPETESETAVSESETQSETQQAVETNKEKEDKKKEETERDPKEVYEEITGESIYVLGSYPVGDITENTNEIYDYLINVLGLNHAAACGVLANIQCESNFASTAVGDGGSSYGLCQWHLGRFSALISWCNANGLDYHTIQGQLAYMTCELQGGYASVYNYLLGVPDTAQGAYDAAYYWCQCYEIPSNLEYNCQMRADLAMNEYFPLVLGSSQEDETENDSEITTLDEKKMEQMMVSAPDNISRLSRLDMSKESTVNMVIDRFDEKEQEESVTDKKNLQLEAEKAVEQALKEFDEKYAARESEDVKNETEILNPEKLAILSNSIFKK